MSLARLTIVLPLIASAASLNAQGGMQRYDFDPAQSQLYVVTHRRGLLAGVFGHEHSIVPTSWSGGFCWAPNAPQNANGSVTIDARTLIIDSDEGRKMAGLGGGPSANQIKTLQKKLLDEQHLDAERHAEIELEIPAVNKADGERLEVKGRLTLKGITRDVVFPLQLSADADRLRATGTLTVRQSDFGIKPESIAGVVKVSDPVDIKFKLVALPTDARCPGGPGP